MLDVFVPVLGLVVRDQEPVLPVPDDIGVRDGFACYYRLVHPPGLNDLQLGLEFVELGVPQGCKGSVYEVVTSHIRVDVRCLDSAVIRVIPLVADNLFIPLIYRVVVVPSSEVEPVLAIQVCVPPQLLHSFPKEFHVLPVLRTSEPTELDEVFVGFFVRVRDELLIGFVGFVL